MILSMNLGSNFFIHFDIWFSHQKLKFVVLRLLRPVYFYSNKAESELKELSEKKKKYYFILNTIKLQKVMPSLK